MKIIPVVVGILFLLPVLAASESAPLNPGHEPEAGHRGALPEAAPAASMNADPAELAPDWGLSEFNSQDRQGCFEIFAAGTLMNTYHRGSLDKWFAERTGDASNKVDAGSPAFWQLGGAGYLVLGNPSYLLGIGVDLIIPPSHSLWGSDLDGGRQELVLDPQIVSFSMPFKMEVAENSGIYLRIAPALLMGWVTGKYTSPAQSLDFVMAPGVGFGLAGGLDMLFAEFFGLTATAGFRVLQADLVYRDSGSSTGYSQPVLQNGNSVTVDMGGPYLTVGLLLHL